MKKAAIGFISAAFIAGAIVACNKAVDKKGMSNSVSDAQVSSVQSACDQFAYADSIFYPRAVKNYIVKPLKVLAGTYGAFPTGLCN